MASVKTTKLTVRHQFIKKNRFFFRITSSFVCFFLLAFRDNCDQIINKASYPGVNALKSLMGGFKGRPIYTSVSLTILVRRGGRGVC